MAVSDAETLPTSHLLVAVEEIYATTLSWTVYVTVCQPFGLLVASVHPGFWGCLDMVHENISKVKGRWVVVSCGRFTT